MKLCDITLAYNESSGGIRTYIDEKRRYLREHTEHDHLLIIPGDQDRTHRDGRLTTVQIESPLMPGQDTYRYFIRPHKIREVLLEHRPEVIELGSYYLEAWGAISARKKLREEGADCVMGCYFHTDVAEAYVAAPLRTMARDWLPDGDSVWASLGDRISEVAAAGIERYIGAVFENCDYAFAPSDAQAARLKEYGVEDVQVVHLGVDLETFHPRQRNDETRASLGAGPDNLVLIFAGRLSQEKRVLTLLETLDRLPKDLGAILCLVGHGPLRDEVEARAQDRPDLCLLPFQADKMDLARLLASADVYVSAGPHETFGLSVIEAQACGLPVVGVEAGALCDRVPPDLGALGAVDDVAAMADNIVSVAAQREAMGRAARRHVEDTFSWTRTVRTLLDRYTSAG
ncbi:glycosyltransferase [uncultured Rhodospira sp.]|uniref:glycosyltransferase n=1 Tax=uncultured Rhodospira sp. TaxID=1936189 RepID=UPI00262538B3|nr:glycosyltransferase [uncultured Rhodospira sp.]